MNRPVLKRPGLGLASGAATGGLLVAAYFGISYATSYPVEGGTFVPDAGDIAGWTIVSFMFSTTVFGSGLIVVGYPVWRLLHHLGARGPFVAAATGALLSAVALKLLEGTAYGHGGVVLMAIAGAMVGVVIERVAYDRTRPPRPSPPPSPAPPS